MARTGTQTASISDIAKRTGFGDIVTLGSRGDFSGALEGSITYFLVHRHLSDEVMSAVIRSIRSNADDQVRFAPVIVFADDGPVENYLRYIHLGFDDVIVLPERRTMLVQRLTGALRGEHVYVETDRYFGPDRRRMENPEQTDPRRSSIPHSHRKYVFTRSFGRGVRIVRTEIFARTISAGPGIPL